MSMWLYYATPVDAKDDHEIIGVQYDTKSQIFLYL